MRGTSRTTFGAVLVLLAACSSDPPIKPAELTRFAQTVKVKEVWSNSVRGAQPYAFAPATAEGDVFAADAKGRIVRVDGTKGKLKWRVDTGEPLSGGVGVGGGLVLVGTSKGKVLAFDLQGKPRWTAEVSSEVLAPPAANAEWVVVRSGDGRFHGLSAADGKRKWEHQSSLPALMLRATGSVGLDEETAYAGLAGGKIIALRLRDGIQLWESTVSLPRGDNEIERLVDVGDAPVRSGQQTCVASFQGKVGCFDLTKGTALWARDASSAQRVAVDDRAVYVVDETSHVIAFDRESAAQLWRQDKLFGRRVGAPLLHGEHLVVADFEGYVHVLNRQDGALAGRIRADAAAIEAPPLPAGDWVVVQSVDGDLAALSIR